ncbi:MAG: hypothetical protein PHZ02_07150 [Desulfocapsaceae bacterium]|nr:hypothetical protein [Desulfocapsaceae bacterium]
MMNVLDLYTVDAPGKVFSVSGGREFRGPCPVPGCGGTDRFGVFPLQNDGAGSFFCGRQKGGGNGCGIGGDAIEYLRKVRGLSYRDACDFLGIEAKGTQGGQRSTKYRYQLPEAQAGRQQIFVPEDKTFPAEVVDSSLWVSKGLEFVEKCHQALLDRPMSIAYLQNRGIGHKSIIKRKLGFWGGDERNGMEYQNSYRPRSSWGLSAEKNGKGKARMMVLPAGLVIPYFAEGLLHRITIRLIRIDPNYPKKKYHYVTGSIRDLWITNPTAKAFVTQEAELDCIAIDEAVGDLVGTIGIGSTGVRPDLRTDKALKNSLCILDGLDFDGIGSKASKAVIQSGTWWEETYSQYKRWPVPQGKDAGEFFQAGGNLRLWVMAGLPDFLVPSTDVGKAEPVQDVPETAASKIAVPAASLQANGTASELAELKELLRQSRGYIRIFDGGMNVAKEVPKPWRQENPDASGRISWLLNNSEAVGHWVETMPDGLYQSENIRG